MSDPFPGNEPPAPPLIRPMDGNAANFPPSCGTCGYNLTGLAVEGTCPECGSPVWNPLAGQHDPYNGLAIGAFVCGLLSLLSCFAFGPLSIIPAIAGVVCGEMAAARYKRAGLRTTGRGLATAGRIMSWIGVALGLGLVAFFALMLFSGP